jgi:hypothetical protein
MEDIKSTSKDVFSDNIYGVVLEEIKGGWCKQSTYWGSDVSLMLNMM